MAAMVPPLNFKITLSEEGNVISFPKSKEAIKHLIDSNNSSSYCDLAIIDKNARTEWHSTIPDT